MSGTSVRLAYWRNPVSFERACCVDGCCIRTSATNRETATATPACVAPGSPDQWPKIGTAEIPPERVDLLADLGGEPQIFGVAEQVAVFPKSTGAEALAGVVGKSDTDRAMQSLRHIDCHPHVRGVVGVRLWRDPNRAEQPAGDQRTAGLFDLGLVIDRTALPTNASLYITRLEPLEPGDRERTKMLHRSRIERVRYFQRLRVLVELDPAIRHLGKRMTAVAKRRDQLRFGCNHRGRARRVAGFEGQFGFVREGQGLPVRRLHHDRADMAEWAKHEFYRDLCRLRLG